MKTGIPIPNNSFIHKLRLHVLLLFQILVVRIQKLQTRSFSPSRTTITFHLSR